MPALAALLVTVEGVEWDAGITAKKVLEDEKHSAAERRFLRFGRT